MPHSESLKVLLLAAGQSRRMQPISDKTLINFLGRPLIIHQLETLKAAGFKQIILVCNQQNQNKLEAICNDYAKQTNISITAIQQPPEIGMKQAILSAKSLLDQSPVLIVSSNDLVESIAYESLKKAIKADPKQSYILGLKVKEYFPGGYLKVDENSYLKSIIEKPDPDKTPSDLINLVIHYHPNTATLINYLEKVQSPNDDAYECALDAMISDNSQMKVLHYDHFWQPIKYPWHIQAVFEHLFSKAGHKITSRGNRHAQHFHDADIASSATIKGDVIFGNNVKIMENAIISGPAYIGDNTIIANNALVRGSHVGSDCVIGFGTEVARSYLGDRVWTHSNYIGDSVIGNNVSFGAGTVTGNLRLDEGNISLNSQDQKIDSKKPKFGLITGDNLRVGINVSFMPGAKVGGNSFIGAGIVIAQDIPENSFVKGEFSLKISPNKFQFDAGNRDEFKNNL